MWKKALSKKSFCTRDTTYNLSSCPGGDISGGCKASGNMEPTGVQLPFFYVVPLLLTDWWDWVSLCSDLCDGSFTPLFVCFVVWSVSLHTALRNSPFTHNCNVSMPSRGDGFCVAWEMNYVVRYSEWCSRLSIISHETTHSSHFCVLTLIEHRSPVEPSSWIPCICVVLSCSSSC